MINSSNINERIKQLIDFKCDGNQRKFAETINFAPQVLFNIVSGRRSKPSFDVLNAILSSFDDINAEWLLQGTGNMIKTTDHLKNIDESITEFRFSQNSMIEQFQENIKLLKKYVAVLEERNNILQNENSQLKKERQPPFYPERVAESEQKLKK